MHLLDSIYRVDFLIYAAKQSGLQSCVTGSVNNKNPFIPANRIDLIHPLPLYLSAICEMVIAPLFQTSTGMEAAMIAALLLAPGILEFVPGQCCSYPVSIASHAQFRTILCGSPPDRHALSNHSHWCGDLDPGSR